MGIVDLAPVAGALGFGSALPWLWRRLARDPKSVAETRKLNEEADDLIVTRLYAEIERIDRALTDVRTELGEVKTAAANEKTALEKENKCLREEVKRLKKRVWDLEEILKVGTTPEDMRRQLAEIDRNNEGGGK